MRARSLSSLKTFCYSGTTRLESFVRQQFIDLRVEIWIAKMIFTNQTYFRYKNENKNKTKMIPFRFIKKLKLKRLVLEKRKRNKNKNDFIKYEKINAKMNTGTKKVSI